MHQLDHLDGKGLACVDIESFVDFSCGATAKQFADLPLDHLPLNFLLLHLLREKVVLLLHLFQVGHERVNLALPIDHVQLFVYLLHMRGNGPL